MRLRLSFRLPLSIFALLWSCALATSTVAAEPPTGEAKEPAVPLKPAQRVHIGKFSVTNSMLVTWVVAAGVIVFAQIATRKIKTIPTGLQNFWEWLVEGLYNFLEGIVGRDLMRKTFWFFATIFIFILFVNWFGLIPGVGTIGWGHYDLRTNVFHVDRPLLRGGNADLNMTTAMAAVFIFFMVGWLEIVSILFRPISLSFRLFGNIYAGESTLEVMSSMVPYLSWLIPIPFYFLEILVGIV